MKKVIISLSILVILLAGGGVYYFYILNKLKGKIAIPYIAHQKPVVDPHIPNFIDLSDKLDEAMFDGLFNISANPSGIVYEDGLGELIDVSKNNVVTVRLKPNIKWHSSYSYVRDKKKLTINEKQAVYFTAEDLRFTLERIKKLGTLSPDYILVGQAIENFDFEGPDNNGEIRFKFKDDRMWTENDIKEVLSFKIIPKDSPLNAPQYLTGSGPYMYTGEYEDVIYFYKNLAGNANIANLVLMPYIDNSTYTTELKHGNINTLLSTPFGSISPILADTNKFFYKSNISTVFFALFMNTQKLNKEQRKSLRALIDNKTVMNRFFKIGTPQQRHIANYKGNGDNYNDYLNNSVFPTTSYYVDEKIVNPLLDKGEAELSILPDTVLIQTCLNYGYREELAELVNILNDPSVTKGKVKAEAVSNDILRNKNYDAVLVPVTGYRSNFLFDLYSIFLREPDFATNSINLVTRINRKGEKVIDLSSFTEAKNFFGLDLSKESEEYEEIKQLLEYIYGFMSTSEIGDKQAYAQYIDELEQEMALGIWLFSLPSLAYFRTQLDKNSIDLYGVASQLSTIEKWKEKVK